MSKLIKAEFIKNYSIKKIIVSLLILFVGSLLLILFEKTFGNRVTYDNSFSYHESEYNSIINKYKTDNEKNPSDFNEDLVSVMEEVHENFKLTNNVIKGHNETMWQKYFIRVYMQEVAHKYALNRLDDCDKDEISNYILRYENTGSLDTYHIIKEAYIDYLDSYKNADYQNKKKEVEAKIIRYDKIIKDNKFYQYMEYNCEKTGNVSNNRYKEYCEYIIRNKIDEQYDYRVVNVSEYMYFNDLWNSNSVLNKNGDSYTLKLNSNLKNIYKNQEKIIKYAYEKEIKHDLKIPGDYLAYDGQYLNTKNYTNKGLSLGFIICFILIFSCSGIVSREHDKGTVKLLLTVPMKREKILISKFIYLIINMFLLWIIGSIFIFIISGINYGFDDLFVNELVLIGGKVHEINYFIWYFGKLLLHSIPVICFLSFMYFLSATFKNTVVTSSVCSVLTLLSILIWVILDNLKIKVLYFIAYLPISYLDYNIIRENNIFYINSISNTNLTSIYGIIISVICTIIFLFISVSYYKKIDIVNK